MADTISICSDTLRTVWSEYRRWKASLEIPGGTVPVMMPIQTNSGLRGDVGFAPGAIAIHDIVHTFLTSQGQVAPSSLYR